MNDIRQMVYDVFARGWPGRFSSLVVCSLVLIGTNAKAESGPVSLKHLGLDELMEIDVITVSKKPERLFEAPSAVQVITSEDLRRSGAGSLAEALRLASNLSVAQVDSRQWAISARGFNNVFADKTLVMIDGRSVYTPLYAGVYWDVQDTFLPDVSRIEVISGPGATQWGANAVNGVINVVTQPAGVTQGGLVFGGAGTEFRDSFGVRYGGKVSPRGFYRVYAKAFERDDSERADGRRSNDAWRMRQTGTRWDWDLDAGNTLTLQGDAYEGSLGQQGPDNIRVAGGNVLGRWVRSTAEDSEIRTQVYLDRTHRRIPGSFTQDLTTGDVDFQHRLTLRDRHDLVWGAGVRVTSDDIGNTPANAFLPASVVRTRSNLFVQDSLAVVPGRWTLIGGSKLEYDDYSGAELEPSVRGVFTPSRWWTVWGAVSRAVRTPSRIDRDLYSPATPPYRIRGGSKVVSEKLLAYELGIRRELSRNLVLSIAGYFHDYRDLRSLEPQSPPAAFPVEASSGYQGRSSGLEFTADWEATPAWRLRAGWTEMRVHSEPQDRPADRPTRDSIARDPNHQLQLRSLLSLAPGWELDSALRYVSAIDIQRLPAYTEAELRLGWHPSETWEVSITGQNLLHDAHAEFNAESGRRFIARSVHAQLTWRF